MNTHASFLSAFLGLVRVSGHYAPPEPEVGIFRRQWEIDSATNARGEEIDLNDFDFEHACDALDEALCDAIEESWRGAQ